MESETGTPKYSQGKLDLEHPVLTQSWLKLMEACPFAAWKRYGEGQVLPPGIAAVQGSSVDAGVTLGCSEQIKTGADAPVSDKIDAGLTYYDREVVVADRPNDEDPGKCRDQVVDMIRVHHTRVAPILKPIAVQKQIVVKGRDFDLAGTIDIVEEGHVLRDLKTANRAYTEQQIAESPQRQLYPLLYEKETGERPKSFCHDVLVKSASRGIQAEVIDTPVTDSDRALIQYRFKSAYLEWTHGMRTGHWRIAETAHWRCNSTGKWCAYISQCPKGKR